MRKITEKLGNYPGCGVGERGTAEMERLFLRKITAKPVVCRIEGKEGIEMEGLPWEMGIWEIIPAVGCRGKRGSRRGGAVLRSHKERFAGLRGAQTAEFWVGIHPPGQR